MGDFLGGCKSGKENTKIAGDIEKWRFGFWSVFSERLPGTRRQGNINTLVMK